MRFMRFALFAVLFAGMFYAGCGGSSGGGGGGSAPISPPGTPVISALTASKPDVVPGDNLSISSVTSASSAATYGWGQISGPSLSFVNNNSPTLAVSVPAGTAAGVAQIRLTVTDSGLTASKDVSVNIIMPSPTDQHNLALSIIDDPDPTAGDQISAVLTKKAGGTPAYNLSITYQVVLKNGQQKTIGPVGVASPSFRIDVTFGQKPGGGGDILVSDLQSVTANITGGASLTTPLTFTVGGSSTTTKSLP